jgi:beta-glucanase (GH16 family)
MVFQGDHAPSVGTGTPGWQGEITYDQRVIVPMTLADGTYRIVIGLYNRKGRAALKAGEGAVDGGGQSYEVGTFAVERSAPPSKADTERPPTLKLDGHRVSFSEEFDGPLDVTPWGPGSRWIAHTPWHGDFGDAGFADPEEGFPFTIDNGVLRIEARKDAVGKWRAGLLCSNDPKGDGFSQQYGYFEMRAKLPGGPGVWPAFWLASSFNRSDPAAGADGAIEIDVIEFYGHNPGAYQSAVHVWKPGPHRAEGSTVTTRLGEVANGFHNYGVMVEREFITMYFDGVEVWKTKTPPEHNKPLMLLVNLALGSGWPIDRTPNPSFMYVDYVRAYARKQRREVPR